DCSAGADPTKQGGELLWVRQTGFLWPYDTTGFALSAGPTGDIAMGMTIFSAFLHGKAQYERLNGAGAELAMRTFDPEPAGFEQDHEAGFWELRFDPTNALFVDVREVCEGIDAPPGSDCPGPIDEWDAPDGTAIPPPDGVSPVGTMKTASGTTSVDLGCG